METYRSVIVHGKINLAYGPEDTLWNLERFVEREFPFDYKMELYRGSDHVGEIKWQYFGAYGVHDGYMIIGTVRYED